MSPRYKILSLDGGGTWAVIQAMALKNIYCQKLELEDVTGHQILSDFDLVAANSGGSLVLAGMAANWKMSELIDTVSDIENRKLLFYSKPIWGKDGQSGIIKMLRLFGYEVGPKWITSKKIEGLKTIFQELEDIEMYKLPQIIGGRKPHFLISAFDYNQNRAVFFRSNKDSKAQTFKLKEILHGTPPKASDYKSIRFLEAVHASSNAPVNFFDKPASINYVNGGGLYAWDGAVGGYNNPVLAAVIEALANGEKKQNIDVLSIGTGSVFLPVLESNEKQPNAEILTRSKTINKKFTDDLKKLSESILSDPPDAATYMAYIILHGTTNHLESEAKFVRLNPMVQPKYNSKKLCFELPKGFLNMANSNKKDSLELFKQLSELDMDVVCEKEFKLVKDLCEQWLNDNIPNQSIRFDEYLEPVLGYGLFSVGKKAW